MKYEYALALAPLYMQCMSAFFFMAQRFSYLGFMVKEFYPHLQESEVGYYAGLLGGVFFLGQAISQFPLGHGADIFGELAFLILAAVSGVIGPLLFAFSPNYPFAVTIMFLCGLFNATSSLAKSRIYRLLPTDLVPFGMGHMSAIFGSAFVIAPALSGYLSYPAKNIVFCKNVAWLQKYPFAVPNILNSFMSCIALFALSWQYKNERSQQAHCRQESKSSGDGLSFYQYLRNNTTQVVWVCFSSGIMGCLVILTTEVMPLFLMLPRRQGGFGLGTDGIGNVGVVIGIFVVLGSVIAPRAVAKLGPLKTAKYGILSTIPFHLAVPFAPLLPGNMGVVAVAVLFGIGRGIAPQLSFLGMNVITSHCAAKEYNARVNGFAMTINCALRFAAPSVGGAIFSWSATAGMGFPLNQHFIFYVYSALALVCWTMILRLRPERDFPAQSLPKTNKGVIGHEEEEEELVHIQGPVECDDAEEREKDSVF